MNFKRIDIFTRIDTLLRTEEDPSIEGKELLKKMPQLQTDETINWEEKGAGENLRLLCSLLKVNETPTKTLNLFGKNQIIDGKKERRITN